MSSYARQSGSGNTNYRGGRGRWANVGSERSREPSSSCRNKNCITISSDGNALLYSRMDDNSIGDHSLVTDFSRSLKVVGEYSEDSDKNFTNDRSYISFLQTKYLPATDTKEKAVHLDLTVAEDKSQLYTGTDEQGLHNLLCWVINNKEAFLREIDAKQSKASGGRFVMMKNVLAAIATVPYMFDLELNLYAVSFNGVIYIAKKTPPAEYLQEIRNTRTSLFAHKFEQYMTKEDITAGIVCNEDFRVMLSGMLGPHRLLYSAATDCADPNLFKDEFSDLSAFVGLKCNVELPKDKLVRDLKSRFMHHYFYCILSGVPRILIGYRDNSGIVSRLRLMTPSELEQEGKEFWNPVNCFEFASRTLSFIKEKVETDPGAVFFFKKESKKAEIVCTKETDVNVLPDWFHEDINETSFHKEEPQ